MKLDILKSQTQSSMLMKKRARVDFIVGTLFVVIMVILSFAFNVEFVESVYEFTRSHESWEMDELIFSFLWIALTATIYGIRRVIDIKSINKEITYHAYYDSLTGLPNRTLALSQLDKLLQNSHRTSTSIGVIFLDLDGFKDVNDSYGHEAGDILIKKVGEKLASIIRNDEIVARLGGDEFLIIAGFPQGTTNIESLINRLFKCQNEPFSINSRSIDMSFSMGVALSPQHGNSVQELLIAADCAMYEAKRNKLNTACYYTDEIGQKISERYRLSAQLKLAIQNEQLYLVYQPIACAVSGAIEGYETLTRWNLQGTHINPELVINLAEDIGLSEDFFKWLLKTTLAEGSRFLKRDQFIAINVSVKQFLDVNFLVNTQKIISTFDHINIEFEITESSLIANFTETTNRIDALNTMGIKVMIDDFGTGYSSLSRLKHLKVDKIKIDREFLNDAVNDKKSAGIYESIVALAHKLDIDVVAEGVETKEQLDYLRQFKPIFLQGYLFQTPKISTEQTSEIIIKDIILHT